MAAAIVLTAAVGLAYVILTRFHHSVPPAIAYFTGDHDRISKGQMVTLRWSVTGATDVRIDPGLGSVRPQDSVGVSPQDSTVYTITAAGPGGRASDSFRVEIEIPPPGPGPGPGPEGPSDHHAPVIRSFGAMPDSIDQGASATLRWEASGADIFTIEPEVGSVGSGLSSVIVHPQKTTAYVLTAANAAGKTTSQPVTIVVRAVPPEQPKPPEPPKSPKPAPPTISFSGDSKQIPLGDSVQLHWTVTNASSVQVTPNISARTLNPTSGNPTSGDIAVSPQNTTSYELTADGPGGHNAAAWTVTVVPKIVAFDALPLTDNRCDFALLRWKVEGASAISIDQGIGVVTYLPYKRVRPLQTTEYTLRADRPGGSATRVWTVPAFRPNAACGQP